MKDAERLKSEDFLAEYSSTELPNKGDFVYHKRLGKGQIVEVSKGKSYFRVRYALYGTREHTIGKLSTPKRIADLDFFKRVFETRQKRSRSVVTEVGGVKVRGSINTRALLTQDLVPLSKLSKALGKDEVERMIEDGRVSVQEVRGRKFVNKEDLRRFLK